MGTNLVGSRGLYGMLAYGFTGEDIRRIRRDEDFFEPLKALLRAVNETGQCPAPGPSVETLAEQIATLAGAGVTEYFTGGRRRGRLLGGGDCSDHA